ncbi:MAG: nitroreductase family protein [Actinobacteria bacterium]|nr:nitroreductase family protein [Actinomycetota bacterium]
MDIKIPSGTTLNNATIQTILDVRSVRKYRNEQISDAELEVIMQCGLRSASAGGCQAPLFLVCQNHDVNLMIGRISKQAYREGFYPVSKSQPSIADNDSIENAFYDAPTVVTIFTPIGWSYAMPDATVAATNMTVGAWSIGVGSCFISRAKETFNTVEGKRLARENGIPDDYEGALHVCLGYPEGTFGPSKPQREERMVLVR